jgi:hypothetical protein
LDEILTVSGLGLPAELRRSLACTNIIENVMGTVRRVTRNVKRWSSSSMALRWTAAAMNEAKKGFRRVKAYKPCGSRKAAHLKTAQLRGVLPALRRVSPVRAVAWLHWVTFFRWPHQKGVVLLRAWTSTAL